jgi:nicotinamidase-related amidase
LSGSASELAIAARPFNFPYEGSLAPERVAILAIDLQVDFLSSEGYFAKKGYDPSPLRRIVPAVGDLVTAARAAGCRVIWTRQGFREDAADASAYDRWRAERSGITLRAGAASSLQRGGDGYNIVPELVVEASDIVVDKTANGAFYQTDLELILRAQEISHLILAGCTTDVCVHSTLREAVDRKFQCLLVEDATASCDAYAHEAAIHMVTVEDGIFGVVASREAVLRGLGEASSGARLRRSRAQ